MALALVLFLSTLATSFCRRSALKKYDIGGWSESPMAIGCIISAGLIDRYHIAASWPTTLDLGALGCWCAFVAAVAFLWNGGSRVVTGIFYALGDKRFQNADATHPSRSEPNQQIIQSLRMLDETDRVAAIEDGRAEVSFADLSLELKEPLELSESCFAKVTATYRGIALDDPIRSRVLGRLDRLIFFLLALTGAETALGFIAFAKGWMRFAEESGRGRAEAVIIGTLANLVMGLLCGYAVRLAFAYWVAAGPLQTFLFAR